MARLDGSTPTEARVKIVDTFNAGTLGQVRCPDGVLVFCSFLGPNFLRLFCCRSSSAAHSLYFCCQPRRAASG